MRTSIVKIEHTEYILNSLLETLSDCAGSISPDDLRGKIALALYNVHSVACDLDDFRTDMPSGLHSVQGLV